jgi:uncharacterized protein (DUF1800 family)
MASLAPFTGALDKKKAAHLLRRTTFGPTRKQVDRFIGMTPTVALTEIYQVPPALSVPSWFTLNPPEDSDVDFIDMFRLWSLDLMRQGGNLGTSGFEKLGFFLHTVFTTRISVIDSYAALYYQFLLLRYYSSGSLKDLAKKISIDNAMLVLLDGRINVKGNPNENYARELFELFTIGKGPQVGAGDYTNYTETDIKSAAKVLSGWQVDDTFSNLDPETQIPQGKFSVDRHDFTSKTFSPAFQNTTITPTATTGSAGELAGKKELEDLIEMIFAQKETAKNYCRKIYRFFMYYDITQEIETDIIAPLADFMIADNYNILNTIKRFLSSQHFFDEDTTSILSDNNRSAIIKSPLEVSLGTIRFFNIQPVDPYKTNILLRLFEQGIDLYEPLDVAGYDAYHQEPAFNRNWISSNNLARRYEFAKWLITANEELGFPLDIVTYVKDPGNISNPASATAIVTELIAYMLPEDLSEIRFQYFYSIFTDGFSEMNWMTEWNNYLSSGNDETVRFQLNKLVNALLQSPEYQLF